MSVSRNKTLRDALAEYNTIREGKNYFDYEKAFELFNQLSDNVTDKHYYLFECYLYGRGVEKNIQNAEAHLETAVKMNHPLALLYKAHLLEDKDAVYTKSMVSNITTEYKKAITHSVNTKHEVCIKFNFLLHIIKSYKSLTSESSSNKKALVQTILTFANSLANNNKYPPAYYLFAELISGNEGIEDVVKLYKKDNTDDEVNKCIIKSYLLAAQGGELKAAKRIAEYFHDKVEDYEEMTWWYWWANYNDKSYEDKNIKSKLIKSNFNEMTVRAKSTFKTSSDRRVKEQLKKDQFIDAVDIRKAKMMKSSRKI